MSLHEYQIGRQLEGQDVPFYGLIQAAMRRADTENLTRLQAAFPDAWAELELRDSQIRGCLTVEELCLVWQREEDRRTAEREQEDASTWIIN